MNTHTGIFQSLAQQVVRTLANERIVSPVAADSTTYDAIDTYIEQQMHRLYLPGAALAIVEGDQIVHMRGFGKARSDGAAPTPQTPFYLGSLTKSFTALAVMQLVEAGAIDLDAPVQRYLPWFRVADAHASAQMTVRHLLHQTSGLPTVQGEIQLADFDDRPDAAERQARALATLELTRPVGTAWEYSNANYNLLGLIIEAASGEEYAEYVQNHMFAPLGMRHSYTSQAEAQQHGLAMGHRYWFGLPVAAPNKSIRRGSLPAAGLISSAEDMARYLMAMLNEGHYGDVQLLSHAGIDELQHGAADVRVYGRSFGQYGMGWFVDTIGQTNLVWHSGTLPTFGTYMALLPEQKKGIVLLFSACQHWYNPVLSELGGGVAALLAGERPAPAWFGRLIPWIMRGLLLMPAFQLIDVAATIRMVRGWRRNPTSRPHSGRAWGLHILLPLLPNLAIASFLQSLLGKRRHYLLLYMPDYAWIALICGSFALLWSALRTALVLRGLNQTRSPNWLWSQVAPNDEAQH